LATRANVRFHQFRVWHRALAKPDHDSDVRNIPLEDGQPQLKRPDLTLEIRKIFLECVLQPQMPYLLLYPGRVTSFTQFRFDDGDEDGATIERHRQILVQLLRGARGVLRCHPPVGDGFEGSSDGVELTRNESGCEGDIVVAIPDLVEAFRKFCDCCCDCENSAHGADDVHVPHQPPGVTPPVRWKRANVSIIMMSSCSDFCWTCSSVIISTSTSSCSS